MTPLLAIVCLSVVALVGMTTNTSTLSQCNPVYATDYRLGTNNFVPHT